MGSYTNPPIITEPNLGKIWSDNYKAGFERTEKSFERAIEFKQEEDKKAAIRANVAGKLRQKAGSSEASVREFAVKKADDYSKFLRKYESGEIDQIEFIREQGKYFSSINKIKELGDGLKLKQEELSKDGVQISSYQGSKGILGLGVVMAAGNDSIEVFEDENGEFGISYLSPSTGNPIKLSEAQLVDPSLYNINEVFDTTEVAEALKDDLKSHLKNQFNISEYDLKDGGKGKIKRQIWDKPELSSKEGRVNYVKNSRLFKSMSNDELGSIYNDYVLINEEDIINDPDFTSLTKNLSNSQRAIAESAAKKGFIDFDVKEDGEAVFNPASILGEYAKTKLAKQIVEEGPQDTVTKEIDTTSKAVESSLKARLSGRARQRTVDLTKQTYDALNTAVYSAEQSGGDANALASLLNNVKFGDGVIAPNQGTFEYDVKSNMLNFAVLKGDKTIQREVSLGDLFGEELLVNSILQKRGIDKDEIKFASEAMAGLINEFDPFGKRFQEENPNINNEFAE